MKKIAPFLIVSVLVVLGYYFNMANRKTVVPQAANLGVPQTTISYPVANNNEIAPPRLDVIQIQGSKNITNASVKQITENGIIFQADQGLVQARFVDLPEEFRLYYAPRGTSNSQRASVTRPTAVKTHGVQSRPSSPNTSTLVGTERLERLAALKREMDRQQVKIDRYIRQSSFTSRNPFSESDASQVTREEYEVARAKFEQLSREYDKLK